MKCKFIFVIPLLFVCCMFFSGKAFAVSNSDIEIKVTSPIDSLQNESGMVAVEQFPAEIPIRITAKTGNLTDIQLEYGSQSKKVTPEYILTVKSKEACGSYTITAKTDQGAVLTITANVIFQVKAIYDTRYRTIGMNVKEIYEGGTLLKSFKEPQRIDLMNANTVADYEHKRIADWIGRYDGGTYTLKGSNVVEIYGFNSGKLYGTYDTDRDFEPLTTRYGWTSKALLAFETMRNTALSYQAPVKIDVEATWCDEKKQEVYGRITAQDKGVPELLYPYQTTSITFTKDDIILSRNFMYMGLEWDYTPETEEFTDGENKTQTSITQKINYKIPTVDFYFKFKDQDGNDLSVVIRAPATVYRGDNYSFTVIYMNSGKSAAYDVPLKGTVDGILIEEIPEVQDFAANISKTYTIKRIADTAANGIHLWANIGVPEGFIDGNLSNNVATAVIKVIDPEPESTPDNPDTPNNPDDPVNPPDEPPVPPELCDLAASILAPRTVYEYEDYSYTVSFTNNSNIELKAVSLQGKNNDNILLQIPKTESFKPKETKSFTITGTAGDAGEVYRLWANVKAPEGFRDEKPANNTAVSSITVVKDPSDEPDEPDDPSDPEKPDNPDDPDNPDEPDNPDTPNDPDYPPDDPDDPSDNPDNPDNPNDPEVPPVVNLCDVWVNLSSPPTVYERDEYSFTVYFANSTDKELSDVELNVTINGKAVSTIPPIANFKAFEKKAFLVTSIAGAKGVPIKLSAQVSPPEGYRDINTGNNRVSSEVMVLEHPYDLDVQRITPDEYKENQSVITTVKVSNKGSLDFTPGQNVTVLFQIPELSLSKRIDAVVMEKDTWNVVSIRWDTPNVQADKNITLIAIINPEQSLGNEGTNDNNTYTQKAVIQNVSYEEPEESRVLPDPPKRNEQPKVTWWEQRYENNNFVWRQFYAELKVSATLDYDTKAKSYLKSGYGYFIRVTATVSTNYDRSEMITAPQTAEVYLPEYRYETAIPLAKEGSQFTFKENPASPFHHRKQYIPVWFPDNRDYIVQLLVTDVHTPGGTLSKWVAGGNLKIHVVDSMYSDDVTTGN
ncbi:MULTISPECIES: hypothetical protein [Thermotaleaceae]|uniref:CARDB protein n=1 Tax=Geosporobacter subterraneus DSM 17957 TaxID=1121919 RepID=A0A1M6HS85_9FIRM|nr:hypothetical protein [Geosporobacter subterraneus]SHJ25025.1 hypothetical protein SAMN02745975_01618 [Geosporobacter subterraneus DSM 17957]